MRLLTTAVSAMAMMLVSACVDSRSTEKTSVSSAQPDFTVPDTKNHTIFDAAQGPALRVPSGSVVEMFTHEATGGQFSPGSDNTDLQAVDFSRVNTMTGLVYVDGAEPGDILAVELLELNVAD